jgi:hypothetical protein
VFSSSPKAPLTIWVPQIRSSFKTTSALQPSDAVQTNVFPQTSATRHPLCDFPCLNPLQLWWSIPGEELVLYNPVLHILFLKPAAAAICTATSQNLCNRRRKVGSWLQVLTLSIDPGTPKQRKMMGLQCVLLRLIYLGLLTNCSWILQNHLEIWWPNSSGNDSAQFLHEEYPSTQHTSEKNEEDTEEKQRNWWSKHTKRQN